MRSGIASRGARGRQRSRSGASRGCRRGGIQGGIHIARIPGSTWGPDRSNLRRVGPRGRFRFIDLPDWMQFRGTKSQRIENWIPGSRKKGLSPVFACNGVTRAFFFRQEGPSKTHGSTERFDFAVTWLNPFIHRGYSGRLAFRSMFIVVSCDISGVLPRFWCLVRTETCRCLYSQTSEGNPCGIDPGRAPGKQTFRTRASEPGRRAGLSELRARRSLLAASFILW